MQRRLKFAVWDVCFWRLTDRIVWIDLTRVRKLEVLKSHDEDHTGPGSCLVMLDNDDQPLWIGIPYALLLAEWRGTEEEIRDIERPFLHRWGPREHWRPW